MPAANIMATQDTVRNSGFSPSLPRGMFPNLPIASQRTKTTNREARSIKSQPVYSITQFRAVVELADRLSRPTKPQTTNAMAIAPVMPKVTLSRVSLWLRRSATARSVLALRSSSMICAYSPASGRVVATSSGSRTAGLVSASLETATAGGVVREISRSSRREDFAGVLSAGNSSGGWDFKSLSKAMSGSFCSERHGRAVWQALGGRRGREVGGLVRCGDLGVAVDDLHFVGAYRQFGRRCGEN